MAKFFNTEGPIKEDIHYFIDPLSRIALDEVLTLVDSQKYFVLRSELRRQQPRNGITP